MTDLSKLREHLDFMARMCDHDADYLEPTPEIPWGHCEETWCMRCAVEEARHLAAVSHNETAKSCAAPDHRRKDLHP